MGKLKLMTIIGTRPEIIRLSAVIKCCDKNWRELMTAEKVLGFMAITTLVIVPLY